MLNQTKMDDNGCDALKKEIYDTLHHWYDISIIFMMPIGLDMIIFEADSMVTCY